MAEVPKVKNFGNGVENGFSSGRGCDHLLMAWGYDCRGNRENAMYYCAYAGGINHDDMGTCGKIRCHISSSI